MKRIYFKYLSPGRGGTKENKKTRTPRLFCFARALFPPIILLLSGCTSVLQKGGEILEGSASGKMELALYRSGGTRNGAKTELREIRDKDGSIGLEFSSSEWPGLTLRGDRPGGSGKFELTGARILSSHVHGWNEFTLDIHGKAIFDDPKKSGGVLYIEGDLERIQISSGSIRLKSSRLTGAAALSPLRNRRERILALIEWMGQYEQTSLIDQSVQTTKLYVNRKEFENFWKPVLFPELVLPKKRPPEYSAKNAQWEKADSIKWNTGYTEHLFPEGLPGAAELREYRNKGALLRDWEEALAWIYMEYSWDYIINSFNGTALLKIK